MNTRIGDLTLLNVLGKGAFGTVFLSKKDGKSCYFATKQIDRAMADKPNFQKYFKNELLILKSLKHPNIVHLEDVKSDNKYYYIVMEYINGGSLTDCLKTYQKRNKGKSFPEEIVQHLMKQIVSAVKYIHSQKIIHRDLKPDNIMVNFYNEYDKNNCNMLNSTVKIIDFGFSIQLTQNNLASTALGSPIYMDPAILSEMSNKGKKVDKLGYDQKADIWSLGTICYELLIGESIFNAETLNELVKKVEAGNYTIPTNLSQELVSFLNGMLQYKGEDRLSADELYDHPFLTKNIRDFHKMDIRKIQKKVDNKGLNINVKRNKTIWSIFNEEDERKLVNINYRKPPMKPIPEYPQNDQKRKNTDTNIPRIPQNTYPNKNFNKSYTQNYSIYGQNMSPYPSYPPPNQIPQYPNSQPLSQPQSYSSGKGGYNQIYSNPTFAPEPITFSSDIYQKSNISAAPPMQGYYPQMPHYIPPSPYGYYPPPPPMNNNYGGNNCEFQ